MKAFLKVFAAMATLLYFSGAEAEDWTFYCRYQDNFFYDRDNVICPYENFKNIISVSQKTVYDNESVLRIADHLGEKYAYLKESISLIEVDCLTSNVRIKTVTYYDKKNQVIDRDLNDYRGTDEGWKKITSKSPHRKLYKALCPAKNNTQ